MVGVASTGGAKQEEGSQASHLTFAHLSRPVATGAKGGPSADGVADASPNP